MASREEREYDFDCRANQDNRYQPFLDWNLKTDWLMVFFLTAICDLETPH
jgi:hypothetical protein